MRLYFTLTMLTILVGCGSVSRVVRLDSGQASSIVFTPRSGTSSVNLGDHALKEAATILARTARPPLRTQEAARRLFEVEARSGSFTYELRSRRITRLGPDERLDEGMTAAQPGLERAYLT